MKTAKRMSLLRRAEMQLSWLNNLGFALGPPTPEYRNQFGSRLWVNLHQIAAGVRWDVHGAARDIGFRLGPIGLELSVARRELAPDPPEQSDMLRDWIVAGHRMSTWRNWRHVGFCIEASRELRAFRAEFGPFGFAVQPAGPA